MRSTRDLLNDRFADPSVQKNIDLDIQWINFYDEGVEWYIKKHANLPFDSRRYTKIEKPCQ